MRLAPAVALLATLLPRPAAAQTLDGPWDWPRERHAERPEPAGPEWSRFARAIADAMAVCFAPHRARRDPLFFDRYVELRVSHRRLAAARLLGSAPEALERCVASLPRRVRASVEYPSGAYVQAFVYDPRARRVDVIVPSPTPDPLPLLPQITLEWRDPVRRDQRLSIERGLLAWAEAQLPPPPRREQDDLLDSIAQPRRAAPTGTPRAEIVIDLGSGRVLEVRDVEGLDLVARLRGVTLLHAGRSEGTAAVRVTLTFRADATPAAPR